ncbi:MAG: DUF4440 domain-containing protein [Proteobacteria bacterium]|nr:DUF4440 domain-containing protein [Pseudomonadota bacterium]
MTYQNPTPALFRDLEEELWRGVRNPSREWLDTNLAEDFTEFCRFGHVYDREHMLDSSGNDVDVEFPFDDFAMELLAPGVALVTYRNTVTYQGKTSSARRSSIWIGTDDGWKLKFQQATTAAD